MSSNLRLIVRPQSPWFIGNDLVNCQGILCPLIKYLSESLNFTYTLTQAYEIGTFTEWNHSWTGALGHLHRNVPDHDDFVFFKLIDHVKI